MKGVVNGKCRIKKRVCDLEFWLVFPISDWI